MVYMNEIHFSHAHNSFSILCESVLVVCMTIFQYCEWAHLSSVDESASVM